MSNRTIAKFGGLVILLFVALALAMSCSHASSNGRYDVNSAEFSPQYEKPVIVGRIESDDITESSGIAASLCQPDVFWTHNDSGDDAFVYAMTPKGKHLGTWRVAGARNVDWEDIASYRSTDGTCVLIIGDIGNNELKRSEQKIYRVKEPTITDASSSSDRKNALVTEPAETLSFRYPDTPHNAETLMAQPQTGDLYVLTKRLDGPSFVFKIKPQFGQAQTAIAEKIAEISVPAVPNGLLTGGAISQDGKHVILCDYSAGYELDIGSERSFDEIWKQKLVTVDLSDRKQGEGVTFSADGKYLLATSERKNAPIVEVKRK